MNAHSVVSEPHFLSETVSQIWPNRMRGGREKGGGWFEF